MLNHRSVLIIPLLFVFAPLHAVMTRPFTLFISPFGHAGQTGRPLRDGYERAATYHWAVAIGEALRTLNIPIKTIISRSPGETLADFQTATFANRLQPDLVLSLSLNQPRKNSKPQLCIFNLLIDPLTDAVRRNRSGIEFVPFEQAHCVNMITSCAYGKLFTQVAAREPYLHQCECLGPELFPYKPLMGIQAPSIALEFGGDWQLCMPLVIETLVQIIQHS